MARKLSPPKPDTRQILVEDLEKAITLGLSRLWKHRDELKREDVETYAAEIMLHVELALDERFRWPN